MRTSLARSASILVLAVVVGLTGAGPASAASWVEQGPGPTLGGQDEGLTNNPVSGAINAIAVDPSDASGNTVYVGTVNGGIWKSTNATAASPTWIPLTDKKLPALSINSLAISPLNHKVLFAGTGSTSSDAFDGSPGFGVARSTNGGGAWKVLAKATFTGRRINSIVPTTLDGGNVVLASTLFDGGGVYRSTDKGTTFTRLSGDGVSGLPNQGASNLVADPGDPMRLYAAVPTIPGGGPTGSEGVYKSTNGGLTWTPVNTGLTGLSTSLRILLSVHNNGAGPTNAVYAMVIATSGHLQGVFRSANQGGLWTPMTPLPSPEIFPGGQGVVHGAIVADPTNANAVFIAGDRQDAPFPNANGCHNFSGNIFRGDAALLPANPWQNTVCNGANGTSPHADARALVFDPTGNILHSSDGGLYRLATPNTPATRQWSSAMGNIRPTEIHSVAYDPVSKIVFGGTQDTGSSIQSAPGSLTWNELLQGDGGVVAVDADQTAHPGTSIRYTSFQFLGSFNRSTWNSSNTFLSFTVAGLNITSGPGTGQTLFSFDPNIQFDNPYVLNAINPARILIGTANIYESLNQGDSLANLGFTGFFISALAYGGRLGGVPMPDVFYVAGGPHIFHRVTAAGPITTLAAYPGSSIRSLVMDPQNYKQVYVLDDQSRVWATFDEGASWTNFTQNLPKLSADVRVLEIFNPNTPKDNTVLIAGGLGGAFQMKHPATAPKPKWGKLSTLPHALVLDLHYDYADNVLVAGLFGRGAWTLTGFFNGGKVTTAVAQQAGVASGAMAGGPILSLPSVPVVAPEARINPAP